MAIALLINVEKELLACGFEEIMGILRNIPCKVDAEHVLNVWPCMYINYSCAMLVN